MICEAAIDVVVDGNQTLLNHQSWQLVAWSLQMYFLECMQFSDCVRALRLSVWGLFG